MTDNHITYYPCPDIDVSNRALKVLDLIHAEFASDVMSQQCFDRRTVAEVEAIIEERKRLERRGAVPPLLTSGRP
jgi:hypothetical protein